MENEKKNINETIEETTTETSEAKASEIEVMKKAAKIILNKLNGFFAVALIAAIAVFAVLMYTNTNVNVLVSIPAFAVSYKQIAGAVAIVAGLAFVKTNVRK